MIYTNARILTIDFETFYSKEFSLSHIPTQAYVLDEQYETIGVSVKLDDQPVKWFSSPNHQDVKAFLKSFPFEEEDVVTVAHNAQFDGCILEWIYDIHPTRYFCTSMGARPILSPYTKRGSTALKNVADYLGIGQKGTEVIKAMGKRLKDFSGRQLKDYGEYCNNDVELTHKLAKGLFTRIPGSEAKLIDATVTKFTRPQLELDIDVLHRRLEIVREEKEAVLVKAGFESRDELMSNNKLAAVLESMGVTVPMKTSPATGKETYAFSKNDLGFKKLLEHEDPTVQSIIAARLKVKSTQEETRLERFIDIAKAMYGTDTKFGAPLLYYGAHTGRFSGGDKINLQNLPRGGALREALVAPEGYCVIAGDLSQIEARMTAVLCDETDLIKQFANNEDVYSVFASKIFGRKITKANATERFVGKTCILGLGYGTGHKKLNDTLKLAGTKCDEVTAKQYVDTYRSTFPNIRNFWSYLDDLIQKMALGKSGKINDYLSYEGSKIRLPNGLSLVYNNLRVSKESGYVYDSKGFPVNLYGAKLLENLVQALARIVISEAELFLYDRNHRAAMQVHDELIYVVPKESADKFSKILHAVLVRPVSWMPNLPLDAEVAYGNSYIDCK